MVIGYNPSHTNINSEVNAPFKILSVLLRYLDNELSPKKTKRSKFQAQNDDDEEEKGITPGYKIRRDMQLGEGERLDTVEGDDDGDYDNYGLETEPKRHRNEVEKIEMTLDDVTDDHKVNHYRIPINDTQHATRIT